jgi:hypothetical protein
VFEDFQSAAKYLMENNYSGQGKIAIQGRSVWIFKFFFTYSVFCHQVHQMVDFWLEPASIKDQTFLEQQSLKLGKKT